MTRINLSEKHDGKTTEQWKVAYEKLVQIAEQHHAGQQYDGKPYSFHLRQVEMVLFKFRFEINSSAWGIYLKALSRTHDIIEDTGVRPDALSKAGPEGLLRDTVLLSKTTPELKASAELYYSRIATSESATLVKLADRIANVETGLKNRDAKGKKTFAKYQNEWPTMRKHLQVHPSAKPMIEHLDALLTTTF